MLESVEKRFGDQLPATPVQWLSVTVRPISQSKRACLPDRSAYNRDHAGTQPAEQRHGRELRETIKRDYVAHMPKPDRETALRNLAIAFEHYNEQHPHSALNIARQGNQTLGSSTNLAGSWCPVRQGQVHHRLTTKQLGLTAMYDG